MLSVHVRGDSHVEDYGERRTEVISSGANDSLDWGVGAKRDVELLILPHQDRGRPPHIGIPLCRWRRSQKHKGPTPDTSAWLVSAYRRTELQFTGVA